MTKQPVPECLLCGRTDGLIRRGLCVTHYSRFHEERKNLPKEKQRQFESMLIASGQLLPPGKPGKKVSDNPFRDLAAKLMASDVAPVAQDQQIAAEEESRISEQRREAAIGAAKRPVTKSKSKSPTPAEVRAIAESSAAKSDKQRKQG